MEKRTEGTFTQYRHYINAGSQQVALYSRDSGGGATTSYFLLDHMGSVAAITNDTGGYFVDESFAAFGDRRDPTDWSGAPSAGDMSAIEDTTQRGFTFHTNAEDSSFIHMNGRVADSLTGRFLSADPYIPNPSITQSFNRYSYVNNNPLSFTDPSGFCIEPLSGSQCIAILAGVGQTIKNFLFGKKKPPKKCLGAAGPCYGAASSSKLYDIVDDILNPYGFDRDNPLDHLILNVRDGRFDGIGVRGVSATRGVIVAAVSGPISSSGLSEMFREEAKKQLFARLKSEAERIITDHDRMTRRDSIRNFGPNNIVLVGIEVGFLKKFVTKVGIDEVSGTIWEIGVTLATRRLRPNPRYQPAPARRPSHKNVSPEFDFSDWVGDCPAAGQPFSGHCGFFDPEGGFHDIHDILPRAMRPLGSGGRHFP